MAENPSKDDNRKSFFIELDKENPPRLPGDQWTKLMHLDHEIRTQFFPKIVALKVSEEVRRHFGKTNLYRSF